MLIRVPSNLCIQGSVTLILLTAGAMGVIADIIVCSSNDSKELFCAAIQDYPFTSTKCRGFGRSMRTFYFLHTTAFSRSFRLIRVFKTAPNIKVYSEVPAVISLFRHLNEDLRKFLFNAVHLIIKTFKFVVAFAT